MHIALEQCREAAKSKDEQGPRVSMSNIIIISLLYIVVIDYNDSLGYDCRT
jgi:hypothetical protein